MIESLPGTGFPCPLKSTIYFTNEPYISEASKLLSCRKKLFFVDELLGDSKEPLGDDWCLLCTDPIFWARAKSIEGEIFLLFLLAAAYSSLSSDKLTAVITDFLSFDWSV